MAKESVYRGRYVAIGKLGGPAACYRVASRSFPERRIDLVDKTAQVVPCAGAAGSDNPFISYRCFAQLAGDTAVVSNGSQLDQVVSKFRRGLPLRDAMMLALLANDFEDDGHATPRILGAIQGQTGFIGSVGTQHIGVISFPLTEGVFMEVSTNNTPAFGTGRLEIASTRKVSARDLADDLAAGKLFVGDPHFVASLVWTPEAVGIHNRVDE